MKNSKEKESFFDENLVYERISLQPYDPSHSKIVVQKSCFSFDDEMFFLRDKETRKLKFLCNRNFIAYIIFDP